MGRDCPATNLIGLPCAEGISVRCARPVGKHRDHWTHFKCLDGHGPHYVTWQHGNDLCPWCGKRPEEVRHALRCPDAFEHTSFADATEAALYLALCQYTVEEQGRDRFADTSDLNIKYRRLMRDLVEGKRDPIEYLEELE